MEQWNSYLKSLRRKEELTIVGPLYSGESKFSEPVIFVDGGANFRTGNIGVSVGDGDSFSGELDYVLPQEKDYSDLAFVLNSLPPSIETINLQGFLGNRRDHELFNLGEAHRALQIEKGRREIFFDNEIVGFSKGQWEFSHTGTFSVFVFSETRLRLTGDCKYQIPEIGEIGVLSSLGLSNIAKGLVQMECEGPVFVFMNGPE